MNRREGGEERSKTKQKTRTKVLNEQNARAINKQRRGVEATSKLQRAVADGKLTAGEALQMKARRISLPDEKDMRRKFPSTQ